MSNRLEDIHSNIDAIPPETPVMAIQAMFNADPQLQSIPVALDEAPIGLICRCELLTLLQTAPSKDTVLNLTATKVMDATPVCVEAHITVGYFGHQCLTGALDKKAFDRGAITTREGRYAGLVEPGALSAGLALLSVKQTHYIQKQKSGFADLKNEHQADLAKHRNQMAMLAHEVRTPLTGLLGVADLLGDSGLPSKSARMAHAISQSGKTLERLLKDMIDYAAIETDQLSIETDSVDLSQLVKETKTLWQYHKWARDLDFDVRLGSRNATKVETDPVRLRQIMHNLISNALKYTSKGSVNVVIDTKIRDDDTVDLSIRVSDTGPGISKEEQARIFEAWERIDCQPKSSRQGAGLGLSIANALAIRLGGGIQLKANPGGGSEFTARVLAKPAGIRLASSKDNDIPMPNGNFELGRLLVADDHGLSRFVIEQGLASAGWKMDLVHNGTQALRRAQGQAYQAILLDVHMPEMDGERVVQEIRSSAGPNVSTPIIAMSADVSRSLKDKCLSIGFDSFIEKPIRPRRLVTDLVDQILKKQTPMAERSLRKYG